MATRAPQRRRDRKRALVRAFVRGRSKIRRAVTTIRVWRNDRIEVSYRGYSVSIPAWKVLIFTIKIIVMSAAHAF